MSLKFAKTTEMFSEREKILFLQTTKNLNSKFRNNILGTFLRILGSYFENEDLVIFEKFHDPGPAKN